MIAPFVDAAWLRAHPEAVVADVRYDPARGEDPDGYAAGHLPGAVFVPLDAALSGPASDADGRHPLPDPDAFAAAMTALGIGDDATVVAYDGAGGVLAARLVWMLRALGLDAALLDGGLSAWPGPLEQGPPASPADRPPPPGPPASPSELPPVPGPPASPDARPPAHFTARPWPAQLVAGLDDLAAAGVLLDARPAERFAGQPSPLDPRPGHIPGARSVPVREHLGPDGRLRPPDELRARMAGAGVESAAAVVSYCGSGVTACHNLLVLEQLGLGRGRLYPGSWSQYAADPSRPVEV